jgi:hypothetical protein
MQVRELRVDTRGDDDKPVIRGHAAVFNEEAIIAGFFREVVKPGAFKRAIKEKQDVRALENHDANRVIGRTVAGTLEIWEDKRGLAIEVTPPDTQVANDLLENIRLGNVDQMSFAFTAVEEKWIEKKDEIALRELIDVDLYDVSVVTYPAYEGTSVGLRSAESIFNDHIQSLEGWTPERDNDAKRHGQELDRARARVELIKHKRNERYENGQAH